MLPTLSTLNPPSDWWKTMSVRARRPFVFAVGARTGAAMERTRERRAREVTIGEPVFDRDGNRIGQIESVAPDGIVVTDRPSTVTLPVGSTQHLDGTMYLMWRCRRCGEMGKLTGSLPKRCTDCRASREHLFYWADD